jgi:hypothetical protein
VFDQVMLAGSSFRAGELDQACRDSQEAIRMAASVSDSRCVRTRLAQLLEDTAGYQREPAVRELREELTLVTSYTVKKLACNRLLILYVDYVIS